MALPDKIMAFKGVLQVWKTIQGKTNGFYEYKHRMESLKILYLSAKSKYFKSKFNFFQNSQQKKSE